MSKDKNKANEPARVQKTLLSFFRPKPDAAGTSKSASQDATGSVPPMASSLNEHSSNGTKQDHATSSRGKRSTIQNKKNVSQEKFLDLKSHLDPDRALFPEGSGFSDDLVDRTFSSSTRDPHHHDNANDQQDIESSTTSTSASSTRPKRTTTVRDAQSVFKSTSSRAPAPDRSLSGFRYDAKTQQIKGNEGKEADLDMDSVTQDLGSDQEPNSNHGIDLQQQQAAALRHDKFVQKLGRLALTSSAKETPSAKRVADSKRRRLIISDSDEDNEEEDDDKDDGDDYKNDGQDESQEDDEDDNGQNNYGRKGRNSKKSTDTRRNKSSNNGSSSCVTAKRTPVMSFKEAIEKAAPSPSALTTAEMTATSLTSRSTGSKKQTKSPYTPLEKQFIEIKEQHPDALLCIEVGYKYRFFGTDAEIASKELGIAHFLDHNFYTASIPIHRLDVHVRRLVHAGHKVGVVKQMETAALKSAGDNKSAPFTRKLTNLYTKATFLESLDKDEEQFQNGSSGAMMGRETVTSHYIMGIHEQPQGGSGADERVLLTIIAVQPATGNIIYDEFLDGHFRNELETRLLHIQPSEVIAPTESMSRATEKLLSHLTTTTGRGYDDVRIERTNAFVKYSMAFTRVSEFYSNNLKEEIDRENSMGSSGAANSGDARSIARTQKENLLKTVLELSKNLIIGLSAMITHLTEFGLAPVFRLSKYFECFTSRTHMLLNGNTLANLEIYRNQTDWTVRGSLFSILDHTMTAFGRRLLKKWVGKPLVDREALQERVDAVEEILSSQEKNKYLDDTKEMLGGLMDLEKGVCRIHYGKSSPKEFLAILKTLVKVSQVLPASVRSLDKKPTFGLTSPTLRRLIGSLSDALEDSSYFLNALNGNAAAKNNKLQMFQETVLEEKWPEVIGHRSEIIATEKDFNDHLAEIRKQLREPRLEFTSVSGIDYLVEVKNKDVAKVPKAWVKISGTKQVSRFHTQDTLRLIQEKAQHQERLALACDRAFIDFQGEFSEKYEVFRDLVQNLANLDCLFSLAVVARLPGYVKPEYVDDDDKETEEEEGEGEREQANELEMDKQDDHEMTEVNPLLEGSICKPTQGRRRVSNTVTIDIQNGRHPMVEQLLTPGNFVPNNIHFDRNPESRVDEKTLILTGPNMGGKSCYIRQVALLCIMAQIGSYLPADSARVSLLDAVYTRMGASDNIFGHESTFMVELQETSDILKMASPRSLVILDELGRGTSTLDGVAIAYAVLKYVVEKIQAITLFVTHYPSLSEVAKEFSEGTIRNYHMGFLATTEGHSSSGLKVSTSSETEDTNMMDLDDTAPNTQDKDQALEMALDEIDIVFLYKLVPGVSMKSYGLNVARLAKLPMTLIKKARIKSRELETILEARARKANSTQMLVAPTNKRKHKGGDDDEAEDEEEKGNVNESEESGQDRVGRQLSRLRQMLECKTEQEFILAANNLI
ncbi:Mismatch repair protein msh3 [Lunasporangiospora selenospora]|uniref:DNA mismatch repair protein MSH3 n=1 Tax=Lunasporangiospora selenospora TaxID=979761 RepID=A0A9P6G324_9FUNG|nr:Mismatch repair protein msh3 [Lunasporangiospora selenospora]